MYKYTAKIVQYSDIYKQYSENVLKNADFI